MYRPASLEACGHLLKALSVVEDPRDARGRLHLLVDVLAIIVVAVLCGCENAEEIEAWGTKEEVWLRSFLELRHGIPSQDTYLRVLAAIDPAQFRSSFLGWVKQVFAPVGLAGQIAIDGKTSRGSASPARGESAVHTVSALACESGLVLGQMRTSDKSNEIVAIPEVLKLLSLEGALVTIDAIGCQREIAKDIVDRGGDYLLQVKDNQPALHDEVEALFAEATAPGPQPLDVPAPPALDWNRQTDGDHGRIEVRETAVCSDFGAYLTTADRWKDLRSLVLVNSTRTDKSAGTTSTEKRYYISSRRLTAEQANKGVRAHWYIENKLHWSLDVTFGEDANTVRARNGAENFAVVRHFAYNLLRRFRGDKRSLRLRQRQCDWDLSYRLRLLRGAE